MHFQHSQAAAPIAALVDVALLAGSAADHAAGTERIAAYALVSGTLGFAVYGNFDIISDQISRISQLHPTPHAPCTMLYVVPVLVGC